MHSVILCGIIGGQFYPNGRPLFCLPLSCSMWAPLNYTTLVINGPPMPDYKTLAQIHYNLGVLWRFEVLMINLFLFLFCLYPPFKWGRLMLKSIFSVIISPLVRHGLANVLASLLWPEFVVEKQFSFVKGNLGPVA